MAAWGELVGNSPALSLVSVVLADTDTVLTAALAMALQHAVAHSLSRSRSLDSWRLCPPPPPQKKKPKKSLRFSFFFCSRISVNRHQVRFVRRGRFAAPQRQRRSNKVAVSHWIAPLGRACFICPASFVQHQQRANTLTRVRRTCEIVRGDEIQAILSLSPMFQVQ